jgi:hypothetical protein
MRALPRTRPCRAAFIAVVAPALGREINPSVGGRPVRRAAPMPAISTVTLRLRVRGGVRLVGTAGFTGGRPARILYALVV